MTDTLSTGTTTFSLGRRALLGGAAAVAATAALASCSAPAGDSAWQATEGAPGAPPPREGLGSVPGAPNLPPGFTDAFTSRYLDTAGLRHHEDPEQLHAEAARSARITHAHPVGEDGALVQAAAIGAALRGEDILDWARSAARTAEMSQRLSVVGELLTASRDPADVHRRLGSSSAAAESVCAAVYASLAHPAFEQAVRFAVRLGGDTDTIAAMTGAIVGARDGLTAIPALARST